MPRTQPFDKVSKYLLQNHPRIFTWLANIAGVRRVQAVVSELVHPGKLPDGLLLLERSKGLKPLLLMVEIATYAEDRVMDQALDDLLLVKLVRKELPEMLIVVLKEKGNIEVRASHTVRSESRTTQLTGCWKVAKMWEYKADDLFALNDPGLIPLIPLTMFQGKIDVLLHRCREVIESQGSAEEQTKLLAVAKS